MVHGCLPDDADVTGLLNSVWIRSEVGPYQLQAAIAAVHATAASPKRTDWPQIAALHLWLGAAIPSRPGRPPQLTSSVTRCSVGPLP